MSEGSFCYVPKLGIQNLLSGLKERLGEGFGSAIQEELALTLKSADVDSDGDGFLSDKEWAEFRDSSAFGELFKERNFFRPLFLSQLTDVLEEGFEGDSVLKRVSGAVTGTRNWTGEITKARLKEEAGLVLGPLVEESLRATDGGVNFAMLKARRMDFAEFSEFLIGEAEDNDGVSFSDPYQRLLERGEYKPLLRFLYEETYGLPSTHDAKEIQKLIASLDRRLVGINADAFVGWHIGTEVGRQRLARLVRELSREAQDEKSKEGRVQEETLDQLADLCKALRRATKDGLAKEKSLGEVSDALLGVDYFNVLVDDADLAQAAGGAVSIVAEAGREYHQTEQRFEDVRREHTRGVRVNSEELKKYVSMAKGEGSLGFKSETKTQLAKMWLLAADDRHWEAIGKSEPQAYRMPAMRQHMIDRIPELMVELEAVEDHKQFKRFEEMLQQFMMGAVGQLGEAPTLSDQIVHFGMGHGLEEFLEAMPPHIRAPFDQLLSRTKEYEAMLNMGAEVSISEVKVSIEDEEVSAAAGHLVRELETLRRGLYANYKRHSFLSRAVSNWAHVANMGDIQDIEEGSKEIEEIIGEISRARTKEELSVPIERFLGSLGDREDGRIHKALIAAEMEGTEQLFQLGQTCLLLMVPGVGKARAAALIAKLGRYLGTTRTTIAISRAPTVMARVERGFGLGVYSSVSGNAVEMATSGMRDEADTVASWAKDAIATGASMALTGALPVSGHGGKSFLQNVIDRYRTGRITWSAARIVSDAGMEGAEETVDTILRSALDGNFDAPTEHELADILKISLIGGAPKIGIIAEAIKGPAVTARSKGSPPQPRAEISPETMQRAEEVLGHVQEIGERRHLHPDVALGLSLKGQPTEVIDVVFTLRGRTIKDQLSILVRHGIAVDRPFLEKVLAQASGHNQEFIEVAEIIGEMEGGRELVTPTILRRLGEVSGDESSLAAGLLVQWGVRNPTINAALARELLLIRAFPNNVNTVVQLGGDDAIAVLDEVLKAHRSGESDEDRVAVTNAALAVASLYHEIPADLLHEVEGCLTRWLETPPSNGEEADRYIEVLKAYVELASYADDVSHAVRAVKALKQFNAFIGTLSESERSRLGLISHQVLAPRFARFHPPTRELVIEHLRAQLRKPGVDSWDLKRARTLAATELIPDVRPHLVYANGAVQTDVAETLAALGDPELRDTLARLADSDSRGVRVAARAAMGKLGFIEEDRSRERFEALIYEVGPHSGEGGRTKAIKELHRLFPDWQEKLISEEDPLEGIGEAAPIPPPGLSDLQLGVVLERAAPAEAIARLEASPLLPPERVALIDAFNLRNCTPYLDRLAKGDDSYAASYARTVLRRFSSDTSPKDVASTSTPPSLIGIETIHRRWHVVVTSLAGNPSDTFTARRLLLEFEKVSAGDPLYNAYKILAAKEWGRLINLEEGRQRLLAMTTASGLEDYLRIGAAKALLELGFRDDAQTVLERYLERDATPEMKCLAVWELGTFGETVAINVLQGIAAGRESEFLSRFEDREAAKLEAAIRFSREFERGDEHVDWAVSALHRILDDTSVVSIDRMRIARELYRLGKRDEAMRILLRHLHDPVDRRSRFQAVIALRELGETDWMDEYRDVAAFPSPTQPDPRRQKPGYTDEVRRVMLQHEPRNVAEVYHAMALEAGMPVDDWLGRALHGASAAEIREAFARLLASSRRWRSERAIRIIRRYRLQEGTSFLLEWAGDSDWPPPTRAEAIVALGEIVAGRTDVNEIAQRLRAMVGEAPPPVRLAVARALLALGNGYRNEALEILKEIVQDPRLEGSARTQALTLFIELVPQGEWSDFETRTEEIKDILFDPSTSSEARHAIVQANQWKRFFPSNELWMLASSRYRLNENNPPVRVAALEVLDALLRSNGNDYLPQARNLLNIASQVANNNPAVRAAAIQALANRKFEGVVDDLGAYVAENEPPEVVLAALQGLWNLGEREKVEALVSSKWLPRMFDPVPYELMDAYSLFVSDTMETGKEEEFVRTRRNILETLVLRGATYALRHEAMDRLDRDFPGWDEGISGIDWAALQEAIPRMP